jgi:hypothetical protein
MRDDGTAQEQLERLGKELAHAQVEMARLQKRVRPKPTLLTSRLPLLAVAVFVALLGAAVAAFTIARVTPRPLAPPTKPAVTASGPETQAPPGAGSAPPASTAGSQRSAKPTPEIHVATTWKGRVKLVTAGKLSSGAPCTLAASFTRKLGAPPHEPRVALVCGAVKLYDTEDAAAGTVKPSLDLHERAGRVGYARTMVYEDKGARTGARAEIAVDTGQREAKVWRTGVDAYDVTVELEQDDEGTREPLFPERSISTCAPFKATGKVTGIDGQPSVVAGDACAVELRSAEAIECKVVVTCGGRKLFDGYARRRETAFVDDQPSAIDKDPKVMVDPYWRTARVEDGTTTTWRVDIDLDADKP